MAKPIHSNIRVIDEERSVAFYHQAFDFDVVDNITFDDFTLVLLSHADSEVALEITVNHGRTKPYTHGTGYGHLAVSVDDIQRSRKRCERHGLAPTPIKELHSNGRVAVRFFFVTDPDGYQVEVVHRQGRYC